MRTWYGAVVGDIGTSEGGHDGKIRSTAWQGLLTRSCSWSRMARRDGDGGGGTGRARQAPCVVVITAPPLLPQQQRLFSWLCDSRLIIHIQKQTL